MLCSTFRGGLPRPIFSIGSKFALLLPNLIITLLSSLHGAKAQVPLTAQASVLLQLKSQWPSVDLSSWTASSDCLTWNGVTCDSYGNIKEINLQGFSLTEGLPSIIGSLPYLEVLNLAVNSMTGTLPTELGNLKNLTSLVLGTNKFKGPIPAGLAGLPNLRYVFLNSNDLNGTIPANLGRNQPLLRVLDFSFNGLTGPIPASISEATALTQLTLKSNALSGSIPWDIGNLTSLTTLELENNELSGTIPDSIGALSMLNDLILGENRLSGSIPTSVCNCTALTTLDLGSNQLTGPIPADIGALKQLTVLKLQVNSLSGQIPASITELSSLTYLDVHENNLGYSLPSEIGKLSQLQWLDFSVNNVSGDLPRSITNLTALQTWLFTYNNVTGDFPEDIGKLHNLVRLYANANYLVKNSSHYHAWSNLTKLQLMDLSGYKLNGSIPDEIIRLPSIAQLKCTFCNLTGPFPAELAVLPTLKYIDIGKNGLTGALPTLFSPTLLAFDVSGNNLSGTLNVTSSVPGQKLQLQAIAVSVNNLSGSLPDILSVAPNLQVLGMKNNSFTGEIPSAILDANSNGSLFLLASNNPLCATSPSAEDPRIAAACKFRKVNAPYYAPMICETTSCATGLFPSPHRLARNNTCVCTNAFEVQLKLWSPDFIHASEKVRLELEEVLAVLLNVATTQVRITELSEHGILRDWNAFVQVFPAGEENWDFVATTVMLSVLESNSSSLGNYFGWNEIVASDLTSLLDGVPGLTPSPPFAIYTPPPPSSVTQIMTPRAPSKTNSAMLTGITVAVALLVVLALIGAFILWRRHVALRQVEVDELMDGKGGKYATGAAGTLEEGGAALSLLTLRMKVEEHFVRPITLEELVAATNEWDPKNKLGEGGYGVVYLGRAKSDSGRVQQWAVKRARRVSQMTLNTFQAEVSALSAMNHRNLVHLVGYCLEGNEQILVYEYVANGTLHDWLHRRKKKVLTFRQRLEIAVGTAQALHYLHNFAKPPIVHRDVKSDNILVDAEMQSKVADFGLLKNMSLANSGSGGAMSTRIAGTRGYLDPEYKRTFKVTAKSDVYSFGVVLLELITGKLPYEECTAASTGSEKHLLENGSAELLADWARTQQESANSGDSGLSEGTVISTAVADPQLRGDFPPEAMKALLVVARMCTQAKGRLRPAMAEVAYRLADLHKGLYGGEGTPVTCAQTEGEDRQLFGSGREENGGEKTSTFSLRSYDKYFVDSMAMGSIIPECKADGEETGKGEHP
eukprot:TRINITY_DN4880_c0_g1_i2.p1 TRINITY_DN4880_c0_g1~~TRINITY_DN4880_c0_g1_i2.p1  ORF type:complete len:1252 (+),score=231.49 TRINITY_DN4880_c0_g1_i2:403-4158(+)